MECPHGKGDQCQMQKHLVSGVGEEAGGAYYQVSCQCGYAGTEPVAKPKATSRKKKDDAPKEAE